MIVPACLFFVLLYGLGISVRNIFDMESVGFLLTLGVFFLIALIIYALFEFLLFFAKARLAYLNSLKEALKIHEVIRDIFNIGILNIIKWLIVMAILVVAFTFISAWVIEIPYVGFLIYVSIVIPILESIGNYSLGLLYSNIARKNNYLAKY